MRIYLYTINQRTRTTLVSRLPELPVGLPNDIEKLHKKLLLFALTKTYTDEGLIYNYSSWKSTVNRVDISLSHRAFIYDKSKSTTTRSHFAMVSHCAPEKAKYRGCFIQLHSIIIMDITYIRYYKYYTVLTVILFVSDKLECRETYIQ